MSDAPAPPAPLYRPFTRVGVVNRAEPALRFVRSARLRSTHTGRSLETVALVTAPDRGASWVRAFDHSVDLGEPRVPGPDGALRSVYVDIERVVSALVAAGCDACWPGWGFASENPQLAEACAARGIVFIGPPASAMRTLGDKARARQLAVSLGLPVAPGSDGAVPDLETALFLAESVGYPVFLKAAAGGGGRGIRVVRSSAEMAGAWVAARNEARAAFGDDAILLEKRIIRARHVEVQLLADAHGHVHALGTRDCSLQRRHQKLVEEAPAPGLPPPLRQSIVETAVRLGQAAGLVGASTAEFLVPTDLQGRPTGAYYLLEVNTRLQVEHTVTEAVTGLDLVALQLRAAAGESIPTLPVRIRGHAVQARLYAEDPDDCTPRAGRLIRFDMPHGPGLRVDAGYEAGDVVPGDFDAMLAKIIALAPTRPEALDRLAEALGRCTVALPTGPANRALLTTLVSHPRVRRRPVSTRWLDAYLEKRPGPLDRPALDRALCAGAVFEYVRARRASVTAFLQAAQGGIPRQVPPAAPLDVRLRVGGRPIELQVRALGVRRYAVAVGGVSREVAFTFTSAVSGLLAENGVSSGVVFGQAVDALVVEVDGVSHRLERASDGRIVAPVPAAVTQVHVRPGQRIRRGERLVTLEVMKMEVGIDAPLDGRVARVEVDTASRVLAGDVLATVEPDAARADGAETASSSSPPLPWTAGLESTSADVIDRLRAILLGYDHTPDEPAALLDRLADTAGMLRPEALFGLVEAYVDLESLHDITRSADGRAPLDHWSAYLRVPRAKADGLPEPWVQSLRRALAQYGLTDLQPDPVLEGALLRIAQAHRSVETRDRILVSVLAALERLPGHPEGVRPLLLRCTQLAVRRGASVAEAATRALYVLGDRPLLHREADELAREAADWMAAGRWDDLLPLPMGAVLGTLGASDRVDPAVVAHLVERWYPGARRVDDLRFRTEGLTVAAAAGRVDDLLNLLATRADSGIDVWELFCPIPDSVDELAQRLPPLPGVERVSITWGDAAQGRLGDTFVRDVDGTWVLDPARRNLHPCRVEWAEIGRWGAFDRRRLPSPGEVVLEQLRSHDDPTDERLLCVVEVERVELERDGAGRPTAAPGFERAYLMALHALREALARAEGRRLVWNRLVVFVRPPVELELRDIEAIARRLTPPTVGLHLEKIVLRLSHRAPGDEGPHQPVWIEWRAAGGSGLAMSVAAPKTRPIRKLSPYEQRVVEARRRGLSYPYELVRWLVSSEAGAVIPPGNFVELDLGADGRTLDPVDRSPGLNSCGVVVGDLWHRVEPWPEGLRRVLLVGDGTRGMGALSEPECRRIIAAFDRAQSLGVPVEWVPTSSGARIAMDSGTENLDWTARVLERIVTFTRAGGVVHVIVDGVCVGAQSYWNAEATFLLHCRGTLTMTPQGSMLLTGKRALEFAGSVSADDNQGIGGYDRILGPNGEAHYGARDLASAYRQLFQHYRLTHVMPSESGPRMLASEDPLDRDITRTPYVAGGGAESDGYQLVGDIFDEGINPGRKRPFSIRSVMRAVVDQDVEPLERWPAWQGAEGAVVWHASLGGRPLTCIGIESRPLPRRDTAPADGPSEWAAGTLFPRGSRKVARAIRQASGQQPVLVLANLSGFDGSPESLREMQLEAGAEIGRAVVEFQGPILFCVVSRYHGGAYVVFSKALNPNLRALALEGSYASVIGGGSAAAVVFPGLVRQRALADERVIEARRRLDRATPVERPAAALRYDAALRRAQAEAQAAVAREFDRIHTVDRALQVGSLDAVLAPSELRARLSAELGMTGRG